MPKGKDTSKDTRRRVDRASWQPMGRIDNMTSEKHVAAAKAAGQTFGLEDYEYTTQGNESPSSTGTVMGRAVEVEPNKYSFEWQNINDATGEPSQNFAGRQMGQWADQDAYQWGYNDDEELPEPYPEGWRQSYPGGEFINEDANTFRLRSKHYTMKGAMRSGRKAIAKGRTFYSQGPDLGGYKGGY